MEETVVTESPAPANVFAFGPEDSPAPVDEGSPAEPAGEEVQAAEDQTVEAEESAEGVDAQVTDQDRVNQAIGREKHRIREQARQEYEKKLADDPARKLGRLFLDDLMNQKGLTEEEAVKEASESYFKTIAKRDGVSVGMAKKIYGQEVKETVQQAMNVQSEIDRIVADVQAAPKPEGFDSQIAYQDESFLEMLQEMPAKAAIRVWTAERKAGQAKQDVAEKLKARQAIPQSIRPQQPVKPVTDWTKASTEDFLKEKARRQKYR